MHTLEELRIGFLKPPRSYGLLPLWDLNNDLSPDDIQWGLAEQAKQGIAGVFLHPRTGMEVAYLSDDYWRAVEQSVQACKALGLETWLYDEYNWPSGVAGGQLLRSHPEYRQVYLDYRQSECAGGETCELSVPPPARILCARARRLGTEEIRDVSDAVQENVLQWTAPLPTGEGYVPAAREARPPKEGQGCGVRQSAWQLLILFTDLYPGRLWATSGAPWARNEAGALDYLNPEAVRAFIRLTHEEYRARFGDEFGKQIRGIFTDEPATFYGWQWTARFLEMFQQRMGYDLLPQLHELVWPVGNYVKTRCDYHRVALDLYATAYFKQIGEWCEQHGLIFTGHLLYEDKLDFLPAGQGGFFSTLRHLHMPGVDYLGDRTGYEPSEIFVAPHVGPKALSSLAHATGKPRSLVELYGGNGWATSLARYKNVLNWIELCGANCIDPHAAYLSLKGHRKRDFPASHFVQNPWWRYYQHFTQYVARLSFLNAQGRHVADIALFYPQSTLWSEHVLWQKSETWNEVVQAFSAISTALLRIQRDYDYLFEEMLLDGGAQVTAAGLRIGAETFPVVILPPLTTIPLQAMQLLCEFVSGGGTLIALGRLPTHSSEQRDDPRLKSLFDELSGRETFVYVRSAGASEPEWGALIQDALAARAADLSITAAFARECIYQHRQVDRTQYYMIANLSDREGEALISMRERGAVERWNVETAEMDSLDTMATADGRTQVVCHFAPNELVCFVLTAGGETSAHVARRAPPVVVSELAPIELTHWRLEAETPNCLLLEPWRVRCGNTVRALPTSRYDSLEALSRASKQQAAAQGLDPSEWTFFMRVARDPGMQAQSSLWPPEGAEYERVAHFHVEYIPAETSLVYEDVGEPVSIAINGQPYAGTVEPCFVWDRSNRQVALGEYLRTGENSITLRTRMPSYRSLPPGAHGMEPVIVRGRFGVREGVLVAPQDETDMLRSWTELGWPHYSGALTYHTTFTLPANNGWRELWLVCEDVRETMEVTVNGRPAGLRLWPPYRLNVTDKLQVGENHVGITVTNTLSNLFTRPLPSGLTGRVQIVPALDGAQQ